MHEEAHEKSRAIWDEMAPGWERNREYLWKTTRHVAEWLVDQVQVQQGDVILDLAGGPGDIGVLAAERVGPNGKVIESDFAEEMVGVARRRAAHLGLGHIEARVVDAQDMDLADDSVDGIICRWGFMLMLDPKRALSECRRVLKEGRRIALSVWGRPEKNPWVTVTGMTMVQLGYQPGGDPFGPGGMFSMADESAIRPLLEAAGFEHIEISEMPVDWSYGSFDEFWGFTTQVAGSLAALVKELPDDEVQKVRDALETNVEPYRNASGLTFPGMTVNAAAS